MKLRQLVLAATLSFIIMHPHHNLLAQDNAGAPDGGGGGGGAAQATGDAVSIHIGPYLPKNFETVDDILKAFGFRYAMQRSQRSFWEAGISFSNSGGHSYQDLAVSLRGDIPFSDMMAFGLGGVNLHRLKAAEGGGYKYYEGIHAGGGFLGHIAENVFMRIEIRGNFNPGTVLFFGFGFEIRLGGGGGGGGAN